MKKLMILSMILALAFAVSGKAFRPNTADDEEITMFL